jgi:tetratricopeptide (TPR) repeat protein
MPLYKHFVGRQDELRQFGELLQEAPGQTILLSGKPGMGKTMLLDRMAGFGHRQSDVRMGLIRYNVKSSDSADAVMEKIMVHAFEAVNTRKAGSHYNDMRMEQWFSFFKKILPDADDNNDISKSFRYKPESGIRSQFLEKLRFLSHIMSEYARAVFFIDTDKKLRPKYEEAWIDVLGELPPGIKFVFAYPVDSDNPPDNGTSPLYKLSNHKEIFVSPLDISAVSELIEQYEDEISFPKQEIEKLLSIYRGHPYMLSAALELLQDKIRPSILPKSAEVEKMVEKQIQHILIKYGEDAIHILEILSIINWPVGGRIIDSLIEINTQKRMEILNSHYISGLLMKEGWRCTLYHSFLRLGILKGIDRVKDAQYHGQIADLYLHLPVNTRTGEQATEGLMKHLRRSESESRFVYSFINVCTPRLINLSLYETAINQSRLLLSNHKSSKELEGALLANLGIIYKTKGQLRKAEQVIRKLLETHRRINNLKGMSNAYISMGEIFHLKGDIKHAKNMFLNGLNFSSRTKNIDGILKAFESLGDLNFEAGEFSNSEKNYQDALKLNTKLNRLEAVAANYRNLGKVYLEQENLVKAGAILRKALDLHLKLRKPLAVAEDYLSLGDMYSKSSEYRKSELMHSKALEILEKSGNQSLVGDVLVEMARLRKAQGKEEKALRALNRASELFIRMGNKSMIEKIQEIILSYTQIESEEQKHDKNQTPHPSCQK